MVVGGRVGVQQASQQGGPAAPGGQDLEEREGVGEGGLQGQPTVVYVQQGTVNSGFVNLGFST